VSSWVGSWRVHPLVFLFLVLLLVASASARDLRIPSLDELDESEILIGSPRVSEYVEIPWVYRCDEGEPFPVPFHVVRFATRIELHSPDGIVGRQLHNGPYEVLGSGTVTEVLVWLPAGFDPVRAYQDTWQYINDPDGLLADALHTLGDVQSRNVQILTIEEEYQLTIQREMFLRMAEMLEGLGELE